jgi:PD-(D/E)XK nuclease superfamily
MITIRASGLSEWFDCAARAEARQLLGKRCPSTGRAVLGKAIHASTAVYDRSKLEGSGITIDEAACAAVDAIHKPDEEVLLDDGERQEEIERIAVALHKLYCTRIAPTQQYAAVEVQCERLEISDIGIALQGTTDRVRKVEDGYGIADLKSGGMAVSADGKVPTKGSAYQLGVYELLAQVASGVPITAPARVIGLQTGKTERGQRVAVSEPVTGARDVLIGDHDSPGVLEMVSKMISSGTFPGNPRSVMCHERYCPIYATCKFRK